MKKSWYCLLLAGVIPVAQGQDEAHLMDDHSFVHLMVDEFEWVGPASEREFVWDLDLSVGGDFHKAWIKSEGRRSDEGADQTEVQLLYSKAILPFWDLQAGVRRDINPGAERNWAALAISGLAPYFINAEAELFVAEGGQISLRARGQYDLLLTQRLVLAPELELVTYGRSEPERLIGAGLGEIGVGFRLRYEIKREIAPYVGLGWHRLYGATRQFAMTAGHDSQEAVLSLGVRAWY